ncbi:unnamed protein product [Fusarium graminearum]|uniref:Chromosome 3, complete genome n=1 Tax=Gibberella zeae (strain ATCC MYA-4620 / CBS 123657 / FGSC 9075 / NRRL 31084 / PH-1) TaxID=229533 RepID=I1RQL2_GIBZE|nr:hypothetical protein FGSG_06357 [Fusarium graminearum PH-1]ESU12440.1 hypothetical protein FGSG_06357 [Fusarium graminearum PH-1]EYB26719.1 hypothetical protein FG05_06357 [Fusarium graminearum]CEF86243.1 unnamed protein product [Fusarium graminearum]CZS85155.1 unnamed protein product [Fusarium graminearum]|eukprot:XP_011325016.1 hypothetical protein FGSG_06357 [Fusarium graminearum PH-1]
MAFAIGIPNVRARLNQDKLREDDKLEETLGATKTTPKGSTKARMLNIENLEGFNTATREEEQVASSLRAIIDRRLTTRKVMGCPGQVADLKREGSLNRGHGRAVDVMQMRGTDRNPSVMPPDQVDLPMPCPESYRDQVGLFIHS